MSSWQSIYRDQLQYRAEIVRAVLDEYEMNPVLLSKMDHAHHIGYYEVHVAPDHVLRAIKIINDEIQFE